MLKTKRLKKLRLPTHTPKRSKTIPMYHLGGNLTEAQIDTFLSLTLQWCKETLGKPRRNLPQIEWTWNCTELQSEKVWAEYLTEENIIKVRIQGHKTIYNLANSIIHEYTHYLQPRKGNWYYRWNNSMGYENNPYEVEANHIASIYDVQCTHAVLETMFPRRMGRFTGGCIWAK